MARKQIPDILGQVLGEKPLGKSEARAVSTSKPAKRNSGPSSKLTPASEISDIEVSEEADKVKVTFYISAEADEALEQAWLKLRRMVEPRARRSVSKSSIAEKAILMAAKDVDDKGRQGQVAAMLVKQ